MKMYKLPTKWKTPIRALSVFVLLSLIACSNNDYTPKPRGYFRIDLPDHQYRSFDTTFPFTFEYPVYTRIRTKGPDLNKKYWFNITYPDYNGTVYFSYKTVNSNLGELINDSHEFVDKHIPKASAIDERIIADRKREVFGISWEISGSGAASPYQFILTDSTTHFLRGALYFRNKPNNDSLAPVINFVKEDMHHFMNTLKWKDK